MVSYVYIVLIYLYIYILHIYIYIWIVEIRPRIKYLNQNNRDTLSTGLCMPSERQFQAKRTTCVAAQCSAHHFDLSQMPEVAQAV